ncbi:MAG: biotin--[acetyl-CoA-carboxylase] ligase [Ruminococcaceae bacterium]|nr:biotin--[acetyl-CoA-carboxylase] ligase [Oscillospiraceae bacterium]
MNNTDKNSSNPYLNIKLPEGYNLIFFSEIDSTNTYIKENASTLQEGTVVVANHQIKGRGRLGRSFYSPSDTGLYFSILLKPHINVSEALNITVAAAVAVSKAIETSTGEKALIKWVNDIYMNGRKVSGILTEASMSGQNNTLNHIVLGIGINLSIPEGGFPEDIKDKAGAISDNSDLTFKTYLLENALEEFNKIYMNYSDKSFIEEYRTRSCVIGKTVTVLQGDITYSAEVLDISSDCSLKVLLSDGTIKYLSSGEISLQGDFS